MRNIRIGRAAAIVLTAGMVGALGGCLEDKRSMTIHEDGSGTIHFELATPPGAPKIGEQKKLTQEDVEKKCHATLAKWEGVVAWTDVKCEARESGPAMSATGWFEDVTKLKSKDKSGAPIPTWTKNADGTFSVVLPPKQKAGEGAPKKEPLDEQSPPPMMLTALKTLAIVVELRLPGEITKSDKVWKVDGKVARLEMLGKDLVPALETYEKERAEIKADVEAGKTTREDANKKLTARMEELLPMSSFEKDKTPIHLTCKGGENAADIETFKKALAEAKKSYTGSDLEKKVQALAGGGGGAK